MRKIITLFFLLLVVCGFASCDQNQSEIITANPICSEHEFGEWYTVLKPTTISEGLKQHICSNCGFSETEIVPKNTFSYSVTEGGDKFFEVNIPLNPQDYTQSEAVTDSYNPIKIVIDEESKTIIIEGDALPPNMSINDIKVNVEQTLKDNNMDITPDFDFDVKIPGYAEGEETSASPY